MKTRVPFDDSYVKLLGIAVYLFSYYEWRIIYAIDRLEPGFVAEYCREHPHGMTSGRVSKRFEKTIESYAGNMRVEKKELERCSLTFHDLVQERNALIHAHPITDDGGAQILNYQASPAKQISDLKWDVARLEQFVREVEDAACEMGRVYQNLTIEPAGS